MMQQVATKRSDVAALPIEIGHSGEPSTQNTGAGQFSAVLSDVDKTHNRSASHAGASKEATTKEATTPSDAHDLTHSKPDRPETDQIKPLTGQTEGAEHQAAGTADNQEASQAAAESQQKQDDIDWLAYVDNIRMLDEKAASTDESSFQLDSELIDTGRLTDMQDTSIDPQLDKITPIPIAVGTLAKELVKQVMGSNAHGDEQGVESAQNAEDNHADAALLSGDDSELQVLAGALLSAMKQAQGDEQSDADSQGFMQQLARLTQPEAVGQNTGSDEDADLLSSLLTTEMQAEPQGDIAVGNAEQDNLAAMLNGLSEQGQEQIREAITSRVKDLMGNIASDAQQAKMTDAVISGIKEMQAQLSQGHEPGFSVANLVTQAVTDAGVNVDEQLQAGINQQLSQINTVLQAASSTTQAAASMLQPLGSESMVAETNQLKSEAAQTGKTVDGADAAVNIQQPEGQKQLAEKIRWMVNSRNMMAEIRLDPPEMGSMQVRVNVQGDAASISFIVQSPQAKDMLSQAEPRLRDMLAEQGINLGESSVQQESQQSSGQQQGEFSGRGHTGQSTDNFGEEPVQVTEQQLTRRAQGGVDDYA